MLVPINKDLKKIWLDKNKFQPLYLKLIKIKNIKELKRKKDLNNANELYYRKIYNIYYKNKKKLDNIKNKGINYFTPKEEKKIIF